MVRRVWQLTLAACGALVVSLTAVTGTWADVPVECSFPFDFGDSRYLTCFRDVLRGDQIGTGTDLGGTTHTALNFTGTAGAGGSTWLTVVDPEVSGSAVPYTDVTLCADVLIQPFNNTKGAGVVARFNEGVGLKGLTLYLSNKGNTDRLILATVDGDPAKAGKLTPLQTVSLGAQIKEKNWYRVIMYVGTTVSPLTVTGEVFSHADPQDPNSDLYGQVGATLEYSPATPPPGVLEAGEVGIMATATSAAVNSSVTNFSTFNCENDNPT